QIKKEYVETGKVKIIYRDFPLGFHENAFNSALAADCANEQGKYWEYHDKLFGNQQSLDKDSLKKYAKDLSLDTTKFNNCLDTEKYKDEVNKDQADGTAAGVSGTPSFFINGKLLVGAQPFSSFKTAIDNALAKA
ncbi:MAG TPA: thioredoxin domain-containing protein, partial [Candidatus Nanoarchaeia archaeon]|nr:thioredoxin domain-containing protein [Candidatus Nanoarchaeia archaeon]